MHACIHTYIHRYGEWSKGVKKKFQYAYIHAYMHTCMYAYIHTYMYAYIHTYMYAYIHTYTDMANGVKKKFQL